MIDLHTHTYYSDGKFSPAEVIEAAARAGLRALAITDHDNTRGSREALPLAQAAGIELIPAVEFTTSWPEANLPREDANVDLLGYFIDLDNPGLRAFEEATLNDIHARMADCCERLTAEGYPVSMTDLFQENPRYGGAMQLIWALMHKQYAPSWDEALKLTESVWHTTRDTPFTIQTTIKQVHRAGGVAVLAHPSIVRPNGERMTSHHLRQLVDAGLDGIEIYHYRLNEEARRHFLKLAQEYCLLISGGSDLHGWHRGHDDLGKQPVTAEMLEKLRERSQQQH